MLSSPMSHYFRHVLLSYREISGLQRKLTASQELKLIEARLVKLKKEHPVHPKIPAMLERIKRLKAALL
ncbi:hypothetical protein HYU20_01300 [Candidatus Woesearchaeota archaeon]|nr:hypothetical protein [Candidatus Woesearchaeota archaeon]